MLKWILIGLLLSSRGEDLAGANMKNRAIRVQGNDITNVTRQYG